MNTKLTLSIDAEAVAMGKRAAAHMGKSLSSIVEDFLILLDVTQRPASAYAVSPDLQSLIGIGTGPFDEKDYKAHLMAKQE